MYRSKESPTDLKWDDATAVDAASITLTLGPVTAGTTLGKNIRVKKLIFSAASVGSTAQLVKVSIAHMDGVTKVFRFPVTSGQGVYWAEQFEDGFSMLSNTTVVFALVSDTADTAAAAGTKLTAAGLYEMVP